MLEQELASIMSFISEKARAPSPYYYNVPQHFEVPAVYFPSPEIKTGGETLSAYGMDYIWYILFFHKTSREAYGLGLEVLTAIREGRNLIPVIAEDGSKLKGSWLRVNDPELIVVDTGAAQLTVSWRSRRPYGDVEEGAQRSYSFHINIFMESGKEISDAYAEELEPYSVPLDFPEIEPDIREERIRNGKYRSDHGWKSHGSEKTSAEKSGTESNITEVSN